MKIGSNSIALAGCFPEYSTYMMKSTLRLRLRCFFIQSGLLSLAALSHGSDSVLTLSNAIETGRRGSPELRRLELVADAAASKRWEALSGYIPQVGVSSNYFLAANYAAVGFNMGGFPPGFKFPSAYPQTNIEITGSWTFFDGFGTWNLYRAAVLDYEASQLDLSHAQFRNAQLIQVKFFQALAAQQLADVANQNIGTLEHHLTLVQVNEQAGTGTRVDVLRLQAQLEEARAEKILADDNVVLARRSLGEMMGLDEAPASLDGSLPVPEERKVPEALQLRVNEREDFQAQSKREAASDRTNSAALGALFPKVSLFAVEQFYAYTGSFNPLIAGSSGLQNAYGLGLKLTWNLFDGGSSIARKAGLEARAKQATEVTRKMLLSAGTEFETWKRRYNYNVHLFKARQRSVEQSEESVRLALISVKAGTKTHSEFLDAERDLFRSRAGVIEAQIAAAEALSNLELAVGHAIK